MPLNPTAKSANIKMLEYMAIKLDHLCQQVIFGGGCTTALFITDSACDTRWMLIASSMWFHFLLTTQLKNNYENLGLNKLPMKK